MSTTKLTHYKQGSIVVWDKVKGPYLSAYFPEKCLVKAVRPAAHPEEGNHDQDVLLYSEKLAQDVWCNTYWLKEQT